MKQKPNNYIILCIYDLIWSKAIIDNPLIFIAALHICIIQTCLRIVAGTG